MEKKRHTFGKVINGRVQMFNGDGSVIPNQEAAQFSMDLEKAIKDFEVEKGKHKFLVPQEDGSIKIHWRSGRPFKQEEVQEPAKKQEPKKETWAPISRDEVKAYSAKYKEEREWDRLPWYKKIFKKK